MSFWSYFPSKYFGGGELIGQGPLWFVEVLLIFSLAYVAVRLLAPRGPLPSVVARPFPRDRMLALFALALGAAAAVLRVPFAIDAFSLRPLNLQAGFFASYVQTSYCAIACELKTPPVPSACADVMTVATWLP
jgi:glucan biosynthesis protein C